MVPGAFFDNELSAISPPSFFAAVPIPYPTNEDVAPTANDVTSSDADVFPLEYSIAAFPSPDTTAPATGPQAAEIPPTAVAMATFPQLTSERFPPLDMS